MKLLRNNTQAAYNVERFTIAEGPFLFDTYHYYKALEEFTYRKWDSADQYLSLVKVYNKTFDVND